MAVKHKRRMHRRKDAIDRLYDSFVTKDMTREAFRAAYLRLTNPNRLRKDLDRIVRRNQVQQTNQLRIDRKLRST